MNKSLVGRFFIYMNPNALQLTQSVMHKLFKPPFLTYFYKKISLPAMRLVLRDRKISQTLENDKFFKILEL